MIVQNENDRLGTWNRTRERLPEPGTIVELDDGNVWYLAAKEAGCDNCEEFNADNDPQF